MFRFGRTFPIISTAFCARMPEPAAGANTPTRNTRGRNVKHHTRAAGGDLHKFMTALGTVEFWDNFHRRVSHVAHRPELCLAGRAFDEEWEKTPHTVTYPVFRVTHGSRCRCFGSAGSLFRQSPRR